MPLGAKSLFLPGIMFSLRLRNFLMPSASLRISTRSCLFLGCLASAFFQWMPRTDPGVPSLRSSTLLCLPCSFTVYSSVGSSSALRIKSSSSSSMSFLGVELSAISYETLPAFEVSKATFYAKDTLPLLASSRIFCLSSLLSLACLKLGEACYCLSTTMPEEGMSSAQSAKVNLRRLLFSSSFVIGLDFSSLPASPDFLFALLACFFF